MSEEQTVNSNLEQTAVDTIKMLSVDAIEKAKSGHPGLPTGAMDYAYVVWTKFLRYNPKDPAWPNRDRFVLSAGHGCMLLYSLLHLTGYGVSLEDLKQFRQAGSLTPGHPEFGHTPGVEATTGPLGQGFANGIGIALASKMMAACFNQPGFELFDYTVYALVSDGDLMEGISHEAASFAGHLGLGNIVYLFDDNRISIGGSTDITCTDDVAKRFEAYGWHVQSVDGHDRAAAEKAIAAARAVTDRPSIIACRTHIAKDAPTKHDTPGAHGEPLGADETAAMKKALGWPAEPTFHVPDGVYDLFGVRPKQVEAEYAAWNELLSRYRQAHPDLAAELDAMLEGRAPADLADRLLDTASALDTDATRGYGGKIMQTVASLMPRLVGGSADLEPSTKTLLKDTASVATGDFAGRNIHFGIREHGMGGVVNGLAYSGFFIPYGATFMVFSDYMRGSVRVSALSGLQSIWIWTHDSIFLGEDGPTHEPIEHLASLRAMPNLSVIRPADAAETAMAWAAAIQNTDRPTALLLSRQKAPSLDLDDPAMAKGTLKGAYVVQDAPGGQPDVIVIATGTEVRFAQDALKMLDGVMARLVSMPSWDLFEQQPKEYRDSVLPPGITKRVVVEAASPFGWERYAGTDGLLICIDHFGASAPMKDLQKQFGFMPEQIAEKISEYVRGA